MELYEWQKECLQSWIDHQTQGIINVMTGAGKTVLALAACEELRKRYEKVQIRIVVPTVALARQWKKNILSFFHELNEHDVRLYCGTSKSRTDCLFTVYVVNSARYTISRHILNGMSGGIHQFLICDECHHYTGDSNSLIFSFRKADHFDPEYFHCLGMSATPYNARYESILVPALGKEIYSYNVSSAREDEQIAGLSIFHVGVPLSGYENKQYGILDKKIKKLYAQLIEENPLLKTKNIQELFQFLSSYAQDDPESMEAAYCNLIRSRRNLILLASYRLKCTLDLLKKMTEEEKVIIFCERIAQTEKLYESIRKIPGMKAGHYHSEMTDEMKKYYLDQFRSGSHRILVTCKALDEGLDVPDASVGIVVSSSSNDRQRIQRLGRILRKNGRKKAVLYYLYTSASADRIYYLKELAKDTDLIEMTYRPEENGFICEEYEKAAEEVINERNPDERNRQEMLRCAELGISRGDWLLDESSYESHINNAVRQSEKNYWNMMKWIHQKYITNKSD